MDLVFGREGDRVGFGGAAAAAEQQDQEEDLLPSRPRPHIHVGWLAATMPPPSPGRGGDGWQGAGAATPRAAVASRGHQHRVVRWGGGGVQCGG